MKDLQFNIDSSDNVTLLEQTSFL